MFVAKKTLVFILASLPFLARGQPSCVDDPDVSTRLVDSDPTVNYCTPPPLPELPKSVVFTMTNAKARNMIVMYERSEVTGKLSNPLTFPTLGNGGHPMLEAFPDDPLASQNSLIVADKCLIAVNAGSNTITTFQIFDGTSINMKRVTIVGSGGDIPVSITSVKDNVAGVNVVYVLNAGGMGSISGYTLSSDCILKPILNTVHSLNQLSRDQIPLLPPPDGPSLFLSGPAQIGFAPDGSQFYVTIKGINQDPRSGGTIHQYKFDPITHLVYNRTILETEETVPFSFDFDDDGRLFVANEFGTAAPGSADAGSVTVYGIVEDGTGDGVLTRLSAVSVHQTATCRVKIKHECAFTTNNGSGSMSSLLITDSGLTLVSSAATGTTGLNQPIDLEITSSGDYAYVLATNHVVPPWSTFTKAQPAIHVYGVDKGCGLQFLQSISYGLPSESTSMWGAVGMAVFSINP